MTNLQDKLKPTHFHDPEPPKAYQHYDRDGGEGGINPEWLLVEGSQKYPSISVLEEAEQALNQSQ